VRATQWDLILGSDLIYSSEGCALLPRVLAALASPATTILYAHTLRRFEHLDADLMDGLRMAGLSCEEVREPWAPSPPPSPDAFSSLFPDMRLAVYRLRVGG